MPLDPSIPLHSVAPAPIDPMAKMGEAMQLRNMQQQGQAGALQIQAQQMDVQQKQRAQTEQDRLLALFSDPSITDEDTLVQKVRAINPQYATTLQKSLYESKQEKIKAYSAQVGAVASVAQKALKKTTVIGPDGQPTVQESVDDTAYHDGLTELYARGILDPPTTQRLLAVPSGPERVQVVKGYLQQSLSAKDALDQQEKALKLPSEIAKGSADATKAGVDALQAQTAQAASQLSAAFKTGGAQAYGQALDALPHGIATRFPAATAQGLTGDAILKSALTPEQATNAADRDRSYALEAKRYNLSVAQYQIALNKAQQDMEEGAPLSDAATEMLARQALKTGQIQRVGYGKAGTGNLTKVANRMALIDPGVDLASHASDFAADKGSLAKMQQMRDAVGAFEGTARANLDLFISQALKVVDTGAPWINTPLRSVNAGLLGNTDVPAFNAARQVAINEIAKVTSNPTLSGQLSDSARHEVEAFMPDNASLVQVMRVAQVLRQDMANRLSNLDKGLAAIKGRISGPGSAPNNQSPPPSGGPTPLGVANPWPTTKKGG